MGVNSSRNAAYPLPIPGQPVYSRPQSSWSVFGKGKKGKRPLDGYGYYASNPYSYTPQPYPYYPGQIFSGAYYPQAGMAMAHPAPAIQPTMQMPVPNGTTAQQQGQAYDPASVHPPPVAMPEPPQNGPVIPPPPQVQSQFQPVIPPSQNYQDIGGQSRPGVYGLPGSRPNPLPTPPRDIYEMSPYRSLLRDIPATTSILAGQGPFLSDSQSKPHGGGLGGLLGSLAGREKKSRKGLSRSASNSNGRSNALPSMTGLFGDPLQRSHTVTSFIANPVPPSALSQANGAAAGNGIPASTTAPSALAGRSRLPPVRFDHQSPLAGFMNHSLHRVLYQNKAYPSAMHLLEALKFLPHRADLAERIRAIKDVQEVYPLTSTFHDQVREDWGQVLLEMVEEVVYLKFKQHPDLRSLLMNTGMADIIYSNTADLYWGEGPNGEGANEFGKTIVRVRERLRREGYSVGPVNSGAAAR